MRKEKVTANDIVENFFMERSDKEIDVADAEEKIKKMYFEATGKELRDPVRCIRKLSDEGILLRVRRGVYKYNGNHVAAGNNVGQKTKIFDASVVRKCVANAKKSGDKNAEKCFKEVSAVLKKYGMKTY